MAITLFRNAKLGLRPFSLVRGGYGASASTIAGLISISERTQRGNVFAIGAERRRRYRIERVAPGREVFDVSVIACQDHRQPGKIRRIKHGAYKSVQIGQMLASEIPSQGCDME